MGNTHWQRRPNNQDSSQSNTNNPGAPGSGEGGRMLRLAAILALTLGMAAAAYADDDSAPYGDSQDQPRVHRAAEIDPAGVIAGLPLLAGGLAVLRGRRAGK